MALTAYLAGRIIRQPEAEEAIAKLRGAGFEITLDWTKKGYAFQTEEQIAAYRVENYVHPTEETVSEAEQSFQAILDADVFVILTDKGGTSMYVLLGAALAASRLAGKPKAMYAVGEPGRMLMYQMDEITKLESMDEVIADLKTKGLA